MEHGEACPSAHPSLKPALTHPPCAASTYLIPPPLHPSPAAGELLHVAEPFLEKNLHPTVIVKGYAKVCVGSIMCVVQGHMLACGPCTRMAGPAGFALRRRRLVATLPQTHSLKCSPRRVSFERKHQADDADSYLK